jgi:hypothetical protein
MNLVIGLVIVVAVVAGIGYLIQRTDNARPRLGSGGGSIPRDRPETE